jgi:hypothetical protein
MDIQIPDALLDEIIALTTISISDQDTFIKHVQFDDGKLAVELLQCDPSIENPEGWLGYLPTRHIVLRVVWSIKMDLSQLSRERLYQILCRLLKDFEKKKQRYIGYVVIDAPKGSDVTSSLFGSGVIQIPDKDKKKVQFDIGFVDESDLKFVDIWRKDHGVYSTGKFNLDKYEGSIRIRYEYVVDESEGEILNPFLQLSRMCHLWNGTHLGMWAAFWYPLSFHAKSWSELSYQAMNGLPQHGEWNNVDPIIKERNDGFHNLWAFIEWCNGRYTKMNKSDQRSFNLSLDAFWNMPRLNPGLQVVQSAMIAESILGDKSDSTKSVCQRNAWVLGYDRDYETRKKLFNQEKELYDLRSAVVHGTVDSYNLLEYAREKYKYLPLDNLTSLLEHMKQRNRELILRSLEIERETTLKEWADQWLWKA